MGLFSRKPIQQFDHLPEGSYRLVSLMGLPFDYTEVSPLEPALLVARIPQQDLPLFEALYCHQAGGWTYYTGLGGWESISQQRFAKDIHGQIMSLPEAITEQSEVERIMSQIDQLS